jgi:hypothetical protein
VLQCWKSNITRREEYPKKKKICSGGSSTVIVDATVKAKSDI